MSVEKPTGNDLMKMLDAQGSTCPLSGRTLTPQTASLDHKVPVSKGGGHSLDNLWIIDNVVNRAKGTLTIEEFVSMCIEVAKHHTAADTPVTAGERYGERPYRLPAPIPPPPPRRKP